MTEITTLDNYTGHKKDKELEIKTFNKALSSGKDKYSVSIRNRLKIDFYSK